MENKHSVEIGGSGTVVKGQEKQVLNGIAKTLPYKEGEALSRLAEILPFNPSPKGFPNSQWEEASDEDIIKDYNRMINYPEAKRHRESLWETEQKKRGKKKKPSIYALIGSNFGWSESKIYRILHKAGVIRHKRK